ncbi:type II toxin-antitoxin system VapC family toxin [bacterium]|nr:type II toxin-antitoxin system VapC family toxin [bacterium]
MRKILIDTNVYAAFKRGNKDVCDVFRHADYIGVDVCVLAELFSGFRLGDAEQKNIRELEVFLNNDRVHMLTHTLETAEYYSLIFSNLRKKGRPLPTNDIWIAAAAMQNGLALYTFDRHFHEIEGVMILS